MNSPSRFHPSSSRSGAALVIILGFIVMLLVLLIAFLSRSTDQQRVSKSSSSLATVDVFAKGAASSIIGDIKQEIAAGSMISNVVAAGVTNTIYLPSNNQAATLAISGFATNAGLENLLKVSMGGSNFFPVSYPTASSYPPANRASTVSTTNLSYNSRSFSALRWNRPLLIARQNLSSTTDFTPIDSFSNAIPQWIYVTRSGANPTSWSNNMIWSQTNPSTVIGRYAYAIYNEGGLLDANVAGYPQTLTNNATPKLLPVYKGGEYFADLTQIGLTSNQITALVGWRNKASSVASNNFPSYTWSDNGTNYAINVLGNTNGFLKVVTNSSGTDRQFTSRQQLISFLQNADTNGVTNALNSLPYLTHYSRGLNQPSLVPALTYTSTAPTILPWAANNNQGGNDGYGGDSLTNVLINSGSITNDQRINPAFLWVRAQTNFTRNDGSTAIPGEPLVKKRFNLNCLSWITYQGPSATRNLTNPASTGADSDIYNLINTYGVSTNWLALGTASNISNYFGLSWNSASASWNYIHTNSSGSICRLYQVATQNREPDFFELLKATINGGAFGKAGTVSTNAINSSFNFHFSQDSSLDYQILQVGANIIDQATVDGYPTTINWSNTGNTTNFAGIKNLPYFNRLRQMNLVVQLPNVTSPYNYGLYYYYTNGSGSPNKLTNTGSVISLFYPEIWNPHDWNSNNLTQTLGTPSPTSFQISCSTTNTQKYTANSPPQFKPQWNPAPISPSSEATNISPLPYFPTNFYGKAIGSSSYLGDPGRYMDYSNTVMTFTISTNASGSALFREPTILFKPGVPNGSNLSAPGLLSLSNAPLGIPGSFYGSITTNGATYYGLVRDPSAPTLTNGETLLPDPITQPYIGFYMDASPIRFVYNFPTNGNWGDINGHGQLTYDQGSTPATTNNIVYDPVSAPTVTANSAPFVTPVPLNLELIYGCPTVIMQYSNPISGRWTTYDYKYCDQITVNPLNINLTTMTNLNVGFFTSNAANYSAPFDVRTSRFAIPCSSGGTARIPPQVTNGWIDYTNAVLWGNRMGLSSGYPITTPNNSDIQNYTTQIYVTNFGWYPGAGAGSTQWGNPRYPRPGIFAQNGTTVTDNGTPYDGGNNAGSSGNNYYSDADGVVRRASGGWVATNGTVNPALTTIGLMTATANTNNGGVLVRTSQSDSRPIILNRPFRSVSELGYTFSGTPFKNLDFFTPESGFSGLLDAFCINDTDDGQALVAGKVDLNTRQTNVINSLLSGAYRDEWNASGTAIPSTLVSSLASDLVTRTTLGPTTGPVKNTPQPLRNVSELVGRWVSGIAAGTTTATSTPPYDPSSYDGYSADLSSILTSTSDLNIQRLREAPMRALASSGQTRVWNLLIDVVAQTGRFPQQATSLNQFTVESEKRLWIHVAIDRLTGQVLDSQIEEVNE